MRVKLGSVAFLKAAGSGYGISLDDNGHLIEFLGDWRALEALEDALVGPEPVHLEVEDWAIIAIDDEVRIPLTLEGMLERARFVKAAWTPCRRSHEVRHSRWSRGAGRGRLASQSAFHRFASAGWTGPLKNPPGLPPQAFRKGSPEDRSRFVLRTPLLGGRTRRRSFSVRWQHAIDLGGGDDSIWREGHADGSRVEA
jgi:hypothetical protein